MSCDRTSHAPGSRPEGGHARACGSPGVTMGIVLQEVGAPIRSRGVTHDSFFDDIVAQTRRYLTELP